MRYPRVQAGQSIDRAISASLLNDAADFLEGLPSNRGRGRGSVSPTQQAARHHVRVKNLNATSLAPGDGCYLDGAANANINTISFLRFRDLVYTTNGFTQPATPSGSFNGKRLFGIAVEPIPQNSIGFVAVGGMIVVNCRIEDALHTHIASAPHTGNGLKSAYAGPAEIFPLTTPDMSGGFDVRAVLIRFCSEYGIEIEGVVTGTNIAAGGSGTIQVYRNGTSRPSTQVVHLLWTHGGEIVSVGKQVVAAWVPDRQKFVIRQAECEDAP